MTPEASVQRAVMDLLAAERIFAIRMNTGAFKDGKRFVRFGLKGMADILAFPQAKHQVGPNGSPWWLPHPLWLEIKAPTGKQSPEQKSFQEQVEAQGHSYLVARSSDDVLAWLKEHR